MNVVGTRPLIRDRLGQCQIFIRFLKYFFVFNIYLSLSFSSCRMIRRCLLIWTPVVSSSCSNCFLLCSWRFIIWRFSNASSCVKQKIFRKFIYISFFSRCILHMSRDEWKLVLRHFAIQHCVLSSDLYCYPSPNSLPKYKCRCSTAAATVCFTALTCKHNWKYDF